MENKVQTNEHGVNVLVETKNSSNRHYYHANKKVANVKKVSNEEVLQLFSEMYERATLEEKLEIAKSFLKKQKGYATSNVVDSVLDVNYQDIVSYEVE